MPPAQITIPQHTAGDSWTGFVFGPIVPTPPYPCAKATLTFRQANTPGQSSPYIIGTASSGKTGMTIETASTYVITAQKQDLPLRAGIYTCRLQITDSQGTKVSYLDISLTIV